MKYPPWNGGELPQALLNLHDLQVLRKLKRLSSLNCVKLRSASFEGDDSLALGIRHVLMDVVAEVDPKGGFAEALRLHTTPRAPRGSDNQIWWEEIADALRCNKPVTDPAVSARDRFRLLWRSALTALKSEEASSRSRAYRRPDLAEAIPATEMTQSIGEFSLPPMLERKEPPLRSMDLPRAFRFDRPLFGRTSDLERIDQIFERVLNFDSPQVVAIKGVSGRGKTEFACKAARNAHDRGARALYGRCLQFGSRPYLPLRDPLTDLILSVSDQVLQAHVAIHGGALGYMVPELQSRVSDLPTAYGEASIDSKMAAEKALFEAVPAFLAQVAAIQPLVLVLDDLQWAIPDTCELLHEIATMTDESARLLVIAIYRPHEPTSDDLWLTLFDPVAGLQGDHFTHLELTPLARNDVVKWAEASAGHTLSPTERNASEELAWETAGNCRLIRERLRDLKESGVFSAKRTNKAPIDLGQVPLSERSRKLVVTRVARLGPVAKDILTVAAVIGPEFEFELLRIVTGRDRDQLAQLLEDAANLDLVEKREDKPDWWTFCHAMTRNALYEDAPRVGELHRSIARALVAFYERNPSEYVHKLAHHWELASPLDAQMALRYKMESGQAAIDALAPRWAAQILGGAIGLLPFLPAADREAAEVDLLVALGEAQRQAAITGHQDHLIRAARLAEHMGDRDRLAAAALAMNQGMTTAAGRIDETKQGVLESAIKLQHDEESADHALLLAALCNELSYRSSLKRRRDLARKAKHIAEALHDDLTLLRVLNLIANPLQVPEEVKRGRVDTAKALSIAETLNDPVLLAWACTWRSTIAMQSGDLAEGESCEQRLLSISKTTKQPILRWNAALRQAAIDLARGRPKLAEQHSLEAVKLGQDAGAPDAKALHLAQMLFVRWQQGRLRELIGALKDTAHDEAEGIRGFEAALTMAYCETGDYDNASIRLTTATHDFEGALVRDPAWMSGACLYAEAAILLQDERSAGELIKQLRRWPDQFDFNGAVTMGPVAHYLGGLCSVTGQFDDAAQYLEQARVMNEDMNAEFFKARTFLETAEMILRREGRRHQADAAIWIRRGREVANRKQNQYRSIVRRADKLKSRLD